MCCFSEEHWTTSTWHCKSKSHMSTQVPNDSNSHIIIAEVNHCSSTQTQNCRGVLGRLRVNSGCWRDTWQKDHFHWFWMQETSSDVKATWWPTKLLTQSSCNCFKCWSIVQRRLHCANIFMAFVHMHMAVEQLLFQMVDTSIHSIHYTFLWWHVH